MWAAIDHLSNSVDLKIYENFKKAKVLVQDTTKSAQTPSQVDESKLDFVVELLKSKASLDDITQLHQDKTNKQDTEQCLAAVETYSKQLEHLCVMVTEVIKACLQS